MKIHKRKSIGVFAVPQAFYCGREISVPWQLKWSDKWEDVTCQKCLNNKGVKMKHKGLHTHRLSQNPLEKKFAKAWELHNNINQNGYNVLDYMLAEDNNRPQGEVKKRDRVVAATVIQWLGSPVGQNFLNEVLKGHIKHNVIHEGYSD